MYGTCTCPTLVILRGTVDDREPKGAGISPPKPAYAASWKFPRLGCRSMEDFCSGVEVCVGGIAELAFLELWRPSISLIMLAVDRLLRSIMSFRLYSAGSEGCSRGVEEAFRWWALWLRLLLLVPLMLLLLLRLLPLKLLLLQGDATVGSREGERGPLPVERRG